MKRSDGSLDATLTPDQAASAPRDAALSDTAVAGETQSGGSPQRAVGLAPAGYKFGELLGRGGMGEVMLAHDERIGRGVAIKRMRSAQPTDEAVDRFLREAKIQARLDHPAIVPVHELGHDVEGRPYFTMKRLTGVTLQHVIDDQTATQQKLLRAFVDVCLAIEFAHARGVVHRDLKPANIMLGDYGEVYVLDWGVARVLGDKEAAGTAQDIDSLDGNTQAGSLLGTPGYMSPEQAQGAEVGCPSDIYALGSILFELLTARPLHPRGHAGLASTITGEKRALSPAQRVPERPIAPELDLVCVASLATDPSDRPTARHLADSIQRYLDGDRDVERRRTLAAEQLAIARTALAGGDPEARGAAVHAAGRALALDPESKEAAALVTTLMIEPPTTLPPALEQQLAATELELVRRQCRLAALTMLVYVAFVPVLVWVGVRQWGMLIAFATAAILTSASAFQVSRTKAPNIAVPVIGNVVLIVLLARFAGPFVLVPGIATALGIAFLSFPKTVDRPVLIIGALLAGFLTPIVLEATGLWARTWWIEGGALITRPAAISLGGTPATVILIVTNVALIITAALFGKALAGSRLSAYRQLEIQAWHLGQLLPADAPRPTLPPPPDCIV